MHMNMSIYEIKYVLASIVVRDTTCKYYFIALYFYQRDPVQLYIMCIIIHTWILPIVLFIIKNCEFFPTNDMQSLSNTTCILPSSIRMIQLAWVTEQINYTLYATQSHAGFL